MGNPFLLSALFVQFLILVSIYLGRLRKFIGFVIFQLYLGGLMVLITYCVILFPTKKFTSHPFLFLATPLLAFLRTAFYPLRNQLPFRLLSRARAVLLMGMMLFLVLISVVAVVDYSIGMIKLYVEFCYVCAEMSNLNRFIFPCSYSLL